MNIKIHGNLLEAKFIKRLNRFLGEIEINNEIHFAHIPNTGRMREFLFHGAKVIVRQVDYQHRKTRFDLLMVYYNNILINIDSKLPNQLLEQGFKNNYFDCFSGYINVSKEVQFKNSKFDLAISNGQQMALIEAKCVTYVGDDKIASFPDAPTERGTKHVMELQEAIKEGFRSAVLFIIQREDALGFMPNKDIDPAFAKAVSYAYESGVEFYAFNCKIFPREIKINKQIPVFL